MNRTLGMFTALVATCLLSPANLWSQQRGDPNDEWCDDRDRRGDRDVDRFCEVREFTLADRNLISVDGGANGGIEVVGWEQNEILVRAKVQAWSDREDPEDIIADIEIITSGRDIRADGPRRRNRWRNGGWSVSFEVMVPRESNLSLEATNGGIAIADVRGNIDFRTTNGGITLEAVAGDVRGSTTNGGVRVELEGDEWDGRGLDVQSTNGGVTLYVPSDYRADLETGTVNGGFRIDFPIVIQGRINRRRIRTELNGGGPLIRAVTTNGGVTVRRR